MVTLLLVRHGQTAWNDPERFRGQADIPLNDLGLEQARRTGAFIAARWRPLAVYASPLSRAMQTAQAIADACGGLTVEPVAGLIDINYGDWAGLTLQEVAARYPEAMRIWQEDPAHAHPPNGESLRVFHQRVVDTARELLHRHADSPDPVVIVGHTVMNRVLMLGLLGMDLRHFWQLDQLPCAINLLTERRERWTLKWLNFTLHLEGLDLF